MLLQKIYQICAGYPTDDIADNSYADPVFNQLCGKRRLASQPTISRFNSRLDESTLEQFNDMSRKIHKVLYKNKQPEQIILDLDSTLLVVIK
ncbi:transposase [Pectinatus frisingensis]|uniref:transposase n=1 Tax=Pectinatus frisingensis TaxID=865 RepID=UPI0018C7C606